jgi:hypothetical protein
LLDKFHCSFFLGGCGAQLHCLVATDRSPIILHFPDCENGYGDFIKEEKCREFIFRSYYVTKAVD